MRNKRNGFTLIELLAVIVVLAIIALIAIPIITNVIDKAKQGALKDSGYGILESAEMYLAKNMSTGITDTMEFICNNGTCLSGTEKINYKGSIDSGRIRIYSDNKIELCIENENSSALKTVASKEVVVSKGTCNYEELNYGVTALVSKTALDEANKKYNDLKSLVDQTDALSTDINIDKKAVTKEGLVIGTSNFSDKIITSSGSVGSGNGTKTKIVTFQNDGELYLTGLLTNACFNNIGSIQIFVNNTSIYGGSISTTSQSSSQKVTTSANIKAGDTLYYYCSCVNHFGSATLYYDYYIIGN